MDPCEDRDTWLTITGWCVNIAAATDEEAIYEIWDEWSSRADSYNGYQNRKTWYSLEADPDRPTYNKLKEYALANGYEIPADVPFDLSEFGTADGYTVGQVTTTGKSAITEIANDYEIADAVKAVEKEPIPRQIRMILDKLLGEAQKIRFNEFQMRSKS